MPLRSARRCALAGAACSSTASTSLHCCLLPSNSRGLSRASIQRNNLVRRVTSSATWTCAWPFL